MSKSKFTGPLVLIALDDFRFRTSRELVYEIGALGSGVTVEVPAGFVTDLASVPRCLWWLLPPFGPWSAAAVLHDYLYTQVRSGLCSRRFADLLFLESMTVLKVSRWRRLTMFYAVRLFGGLSV